MMEHECGSEMSGSSHSNLGLRIGGAVGILLAGLIGFSIPLLAGGRFHRLLFLFRTFAAGVVLSTVFVHILPEAHEKLTNPCLKLSTEYPWAFLIALSSSLLTFCFENFLKTLLSKSGDQADGSQDLEGAKSNESLDQSLKFRVTAYTLETGIIFHSIFIGLSLGTDLEAKSARTLAIALIFHQAFEGISLGAAFRETKSNMIQLVLMGSAFSLTTPLGVAIGMGVASSYNENSREALGIEGVISAFSAGILIFTGYVDLLLPAFEERNSKRRSGILNALGYFFLALGAAALALIGKWS